MRLWFLLPAVSARLLHSLPDDTYAFPKFRVSFLNSLPVLNETAEHWLKEGLSGGELEFLDKPWRDTDWPSSSHPKEIGTGETTPITDVCPPTYCNVCCNSNFTRLVTANLFSSKLYLGTHENGTPGLLHLSDTETL